MPVEETKFMPFGQVVSNEAGRSLTTVTDESDADLFRLQVLAEYLRDKGALKAAVLHMSFIPYSQMDRDMPGHLFSLKYVAKLINACGFRKVYVDDPHSSVSEALLDRVEVDYSTPRILVHDIMTHGKYDIVMYPDAGAAKKYGEVLTNPYIIGASDNPDRKCGTSEAAMLGVQVVRGVKRRNLLTGEIVSYELEVPEGCIISGKRVAIVDDLVMGGRTFKEAAKRLREAGASFVALYVSHLMPQSKEFVDTLGDGTLDVICSGFRKFSRNQAGFVTNCTCDDVY